MRYVDDVVIATPTVANQIHDCMKRAGLNGKPSKCEIRRVSTKYLGRQAWCEAVSGCGGGRVNMEGHQNGHAAHELPGIFQILPRVHQRIHTKGVPNAETNAQQRQEFRME